MPSHLLLPIVPFEALYYFETNAFKPNDFELNCYPNPFNSRLTIQAPMGAKIEIYDINGKLVKTVINEFQMEGLYEINWNGEDNYNNKVPSGIYFYRIKAGNFIDIKKMTLLK